MRPVSRQVGDPTVCVSSSDPEGLGLKDVTSSTPPVIGVTDLDSVGVTFLPSGLRPKDPTFVTFRRPTSPHVTVTVDFTTRTTTLQTHPFHLVVATGRRATISPYTGGPGFRPTNRRSSPRVFRIRLYRPGLSIVPSEVVKMDSGPERVICWGDDTGDHTRDPVPTGFSGYRGDPVTVTVGGVGELSVSPGGTVRQGPVPENVLKVSLH